MKLWVRLEYHQGVCELIFTELSFSLDTAAIRICLLRYNDLVSLSLHMYTPRCLLSKQVDTRQNSISHTDGNILPVPIRTCVTSFVALPFPGVYVIAGCSASVSKRPHLISGFLRPIVTCSRIFLDSTKLADWKSKHANYDLLLWEI